MPDDISVLGFGAGKPSNWNLCSKAVFVLVALLVTKTTCLEVDEPGLVAESSTVKVRGEDGDGGVIDEGATLEFMFLHLGLGNCGLTHDVLVACNGFPRVVSSHCVRARAHAVWAQRLHLRCTEIFRGNGLLA